MLRATAAALSSLPAASASVYFTIACCVFPIANKSSPCLRLSKDMVLRGKSEGGQEGVDKEWRWGGRSRQVGLSRCGTTAYDFAQSNSVHICSYDMRCADLRARFLCPRRADCRTCCSCSCYCDNSSYDARRNGFHDNPPVTHLTFEAARHELTLCQEQRPRSRRSACTSSASCAHE